MSEADGTCFVCGVEAAEDTMILVNPSRRVSAGGAAKDAVIGGWLVCRDKRACWARSKERGGRVGVKESLR